MRQGIVATREASLRVRQAPSLEAKIAGRLERGARVEIRGQQGSWYQVAAAGLEGWAHSDFIRIDEVSVIAGFLRDNAALRRAALAPLTPLAAPPGASPAARGLATCWNSYGGLTGRVASALETASGPAMAVLMVESGGDPFDAAGRVIIRFENHIFWRYFGERNPEVFNRHFVFNAQRRWQGHRFRPDAAGPWISFHGDNAREWQALEFAATLDENAAYRSASFGMAQVMGFNHSRLGYTTAREMADAKQADVRFHILGLFDFVKGPGPTSELLEALRRRDFLKFATAYNGPGQAPQYAAKLEHFATAWTTLPAAPA
jgi:hypothetical protein